MELFEPTDDWYHKEKQEHERRQQKVAAETRRLLTKKERSMPTTTIKEQVEELVQSEAERRYNRLYGVNHPGLTIEKVRSDLWAEPTGKILQGLIRSRYAAMTVTKAKTEVFKSKNPNDRDALDAALRTLEDGWRR